MAVFTLLTLTKLNSILANSNSTLADNQKYIFLSSHKKTLFHRITCTKVTYTDITSVNNCVPHSGPINILRFGVLIPKNSLIFLGVLFKCDNFEGSSE